MPLTNRPPAQTNQGKAAQLEDLEHRLLLSGSPGRGDEGDHLRASTQVVTADFNGDGKADIASVTTVKGRKQSTSTSLIVQLGNGDGTFGPAISKTAVAAGSKVVAGDFNHDGKQDLAILGVDAASGNTSATLYTGDGAGRFTAGTPQNLGVLPLANVGAGDVNGDGFADLVAWNKDSVYVALNDGTGKLLPAVQNDNPFGTIATPVALGDLDGDGRPELIGVNGNQIFPNKAVASTGQYMVNFPLTLTNQIPLAGKKIVVADVNGDGKNDFVALGDGSVYVALQVAAPGSSVLTFGPWVRTSAGGDLTHALVADVNGDGKADVFVPDGKQGVVSRSSLTLISNGDGTFSKLSDRRKGDHDHDDDNNDDDDMQD